MRCGSRPRQAIRGLALTLGLATPVTAGTSPCLEPASDCSLREVAALGEVWMGSAVGPALLADDSPELQYREIFAREFNSLTAENDMKWPRLHPAAGVWDFEAADALVAFAERYAQRVRGHTLVWSREIPEYVRDLVDDPESARAALEEHVATVVSRYAGRIDVWDVVNEPLTLPGDAVETNVFFEQLGQDYIALAFRRAHAADPDARLMLNEVFLEMPGRKLDRFVQLVTELQADGVPLHGVGIQAHFILGEPSSESLGAAIASLARLGVFVELTELDIPVAPGLPDRLEMQRQHYEGVVKACMSHPACEAVTTWGFTDRHTWMDGLLGPGYSPLLWDESYRRKPAYEGVRDALRVRALPEPDAAIRAGTALAVLLGAARRRRRRLNQAHLSGPLSAKLFPRGLHPGAELMDTRVRRPQAALDGPYSGARAHQRQSPRPE